MDELKLQMAANGLVQDCGILLLTEMSTVSLLCYVLCNQWPQVQMLLVTPPHFRCKSRILFCNVCFPRVAGGSVFSAHQWLQVQMLLVTPPHSR